MTFELRKWWRWLYWQPLRRQYQHLLKDARRAFYYGHSIGDNILLTCVIREWCKRDFSSLAVLTPYPELFDGLEKKLVIAPLEFGELHILQNLGVRSFYCSYDREPLPGWPADYHPRGENHILGEMLRRTGLKGEVELLPRIFLKQNELDTIQLNKPFIVLHSTSLRQTFQPYNKEWGVEKWRHLVEQLKNLVETVQVGGTTDPVIGATHDLRGRTSLRETAALMTKSIGVVCQEGMLMHLARAVDRRSVTIYGGSQLPRHTGYTANINLWSQPHCSPCFRLQECPQGQLICMEQIRVSDAFSAVQEMITRKDESLFIDKCTI